MSLPRSAFKTGGGGGSGGSGDVTAAAVIPDNEIVRGDGGAKGVQGSGITIADGAAGTLAGTNSGDVTLAGTPDYITLANQVITRNKLDPADDLNTFASSVLAALVTDETGTDKVVFNTDPVFASTITVPNVGLHLLDTNASHDLIVKPGSDLTADHTLTVTTGDADRTLTLTGDASITGTNTGDGIGGTVGILDEAIPRADGTGAATVQGGSLFYTDGTSPILQFGGTTSSFPAVKRSTFAGQTADLRFQLADDSAFTNVHAGAYCLGNETLASAGGINANLSASGIEFGGAQSVAWYTSSTIRTALSKVGTTTNGVRVWDATSPGYLLSSVLVEANTAGSGAPNVLVATESGTVLTNEGTTAANYHTLPTAVAGYWFCFIVQDADGLRVTCATGDTIRLAGSVSATAGYAESTTIGDMIEGFSVNAAEWICSFTGTGWAVV